MQVSDFFNKLPLWGGNGEIMDGFDEKTGELKPLTDEQKSQIAYPCNKIQIICSGVKALRKELRMIKFKTYETDEDVLSLYTFLSESEKGFLVGELGRIVQELLEDEYVFEGFVPVNCIWVEMFQIDSDDAFVMCSTSALE
jgi:hypothetical protein